MLTATLLHTLYIVMILLHKIESIAVYQSPCQSRKSLGLIIDSRQVQTKEGDE